MQTKQSSKQKIEALAAVLKQAHAAAIAADPGSDGGTCNFDTPAFRVVQMKDTDIQAAAKLAGVEVMSFNWFGRQRWYWLNVPLHGQGHRRTTMMEAAQRVLTDARDSIEGFEACGYYQMD